MRIISCVIQINNAVNASLEAAKWGDKGGSCRDDAAVSSYSWAAINAPDDYDQLSALLDPVFAPQDVAARLKSAISPAIKGILVERGYVDKDYRSTFYHFYAKKGRVYRSDCVRLHFFDECVAFDEGKAALSSSDGEPGDHYYGYVVLRPTLVSTIGRSILSPDIRMGARGMVIQAEHQIHLLGYKFRVWGFPSMAQHTDIAVCAHVSCWAILRHYSEKFPQHRELLIHDITKLAQQFDPGGLTPSLGLNVLHAERIFQAAGSFPVVVKRQQVGADDRFTAQLLAYLESGFPLFIEMAAKRHAIVAIGHSWSNVPAVAPLASSLSSSRLGAIVTVDDNHLPYTQIESAIGGQYNLNDISGFIVPLPDKLYYPADAVDGHSIALYKAMASKLALPPADNLIRRYYVTTLSGLRRYARKHASQLGDILVGAIMRLRTTQFIWVVEYASADQWNQAHVAARAILDASASLYDPAPIWFMHDETHAIFFNRDSSAATATMIDLQRPSGTPLGRMEQNLRPIKPRT